MVFTKNSKRKAVQDPQSFHATSAPSQKEAMTPLKSKAPLVLLILDGWGVDAPHPYNAITQAHTPQWDAWWKTCPHALLEASGEAVGLTAGQIGNSEVGHLHLGAGR